MRYHLNFNLKPSLKLMKFLLSTFFLFSAFIFYENKVFALTDSQIIDICQKKWRKSTCIKYLKNKRLNLLKGYRIDIPVIPFKR